MNPRRRPEAPHRVGRRSAGLVLAPTALVIATLAFAQAGGEYEISRSTIASGTTANGNEFTVQNVVGQPEADPAPAKGGEYTLRGGFLSTRATDRGELVFADGFEPLTATPR